MVKLTSKIIEISVSLESYMRDEHYHSFSLDFPSAHDWMSTKWQNILCSAPINQGGLENDGNRKFDC